MQKLMPAPTPMLKRCTLHVVQPVMAILPLLTLTRQLKFPREMVTLPPI